MLNALNTKYPFGYFMDMEAWPNEDKPLEDQSECILYTEALRDDPGCIILRDQVYKGPDGSLWEIKIGDYTDGASIPWFLRWYISPFAEKIREAAAFHDRYCKLKIYPQKMTHLLFWWILRLDGVTRRRAFVCWLAVRVFCYLRFPKWK